MDERCRTSRPGPGDDAPQRIAGVDRGPVGEQPVLGIVRARLVAACSAADQPVAVRVVGVGGHDGPVAGDPGEPPRFVVTVVEPAGHPLHRLRPGHDPAGQVALEGVGVERRGPRLGAEADGLPVGVVRVGGGHHAERRARDPPGRGVARDGEGAGLHREAVGVVAVGRERRAAYGQGGDAAVRPVRPLDDARHGATPGLRDDE